MTRGNRSADYSAANEIMKQFDPDYASITLGSNKAPAEFTWHHMDDLEVDANGAWCTMQLVETRVHEAAGMRHSGAVAQLDRYYKIEVDLTDND
jgi:A nuclease of the HNH/ENDO VII superfamily with conserved WHH